MISGNAPTASGSLPRRAMAWSFHDRDLDTTFDEWAENKDAGERFDLLLGLVELTDCPLTELPGFPLPGRTPMWRWAKIGRTLVIFLVAEPQGQLVPVEIQDE
jgi:hypothetical protein